VVASLKARKRLLAAVAETHFACFRGRLSSLLEIARRVLFVSAERLGPRRPTFPLLIHIYERRVRR
jgi:hypothetical protein